VGIPQLAGSLSKWNYTVCASAKKLIVLFMRLCRIKNWG